MKKLLLLLASGSVAFATNAQHRVMTPVSADSKNTAAKFDKLYSIPATKKAHKGTAAPRTYSHAAYFDTVLQDVHGLQSANTTILMWQDTTSLAGFTTGYDNINMVSIGSILHPQSAGLNKPEYYQGEMKIGPSDAYIVSGVTIYGVYDFDAANTQVDTLVLSFVYGNGNNTAASNGIFRGGRVSGSHYGDWPVVTTRFDTTELSYARINATQGTPNPYVIKVPLGPTAFGDTLSNGVWTKDISLSTLGAGGLNVPAGNQVGMSYTFKSGRAFTAAPDTIFYSSGVMKHNMWRPLVRFATNSGTTAGVQFAPYDSTDFNEGLYKRLPHNANGWAYMYLPHWAWTGVPSGAWTGQYPIVDWDITCVACGVVPPPTVGVGNTSLIRTTAAFPNPANNELQVPFTLGETANVTVTLSNLLGQTVATRVMGNVASGKATFNTLTLPAGVYTYTVIANGERTTGRAVIAH
ncbi:MAG: T9SS type A sorting domain-containing protein [Taibaiella sp.]|nr:T9SS type A sorting domain-containing protein [Taibaiella sp.]